MGPPARHLATRLLALLALPAAGCWAVDTRSEVLSAAPAPDGSCRERDDPALSLNVPQNSRCTPARLESVDDGPVPERAADGKLRCYYLVSVSRTQRPEFCISGGRPLRLRGASITATLCGSKGWG